MHFSLRRPGGLAALGLVALAPAARAQDLFVSNRDTSTISRFASTGPGTFATTPTLLTAPSLNDPIGLAFDARGDLFASDTASNNNTYTITEFLAGPRPEPSARAQWSRPA